MVDTQDCSPYKTVMGMSSLRSASRGNIGLLAHAKPVIMLWNADSPLELEKWLKIADV